MVDAFWCKNVGKSQKNYIYREANETQGTADVFRWSSDYGNLTIVFLDSLYLVFENFKNKD